MKLSLVLGMNTSSSGLNNERWVIRVKYWIIRCLWLESGLDEPHHLMLGHATQSVYHNTHTTNIFFRQNGPSTGNNISLSIPSFSN